ncbi:MAG: DUF1697 domain-containing protein [Planctomycetaceae bacterium]
MPTWIGLLRGVNVGGKNRMSMAQLTELLKSIGCTDVQTYIQSGNVVLGSRLKSKASLSHRIVDAIEEVFRFRPHCLLLRPTEFRSAVENNPFSEAMADPKSLHFFFLDSTPENPDLDAIERLATESERYQLIGEVFYIHAPEGIGRSKLAATAEKKLGVPTTARNYNTVAALSRLLSNG